MLLVFSKLVTEVLVDIQSAVVVFVLWFGGVSDEQTQERLKPTQA